MRNTLLTSMEDYEDSGDDGARLEHELEQVEEGIKRWDQMRAVLEMYDMHHRESVEYEESASDIDSGKEYLAKHRIVMECRLDSAGEESHTSEESESDEGSTETMWGVVERYSPVAVQTV